MIRPTVLPSYDELGLRRRKLRERQHAEPAVGVPAVVQPRDRLLSRIAALGEADRALGQPGLGGQHPVVDLLPPRRRPRPDAEQLELLRRHARFELGVEHLRGRLAVVARRNPLAAEDDVRGVLLRLDLGLRREAGAEQLGPDALAELGLGQEQEVLVPAPQHDERRDHARLRGQQQRLARLAGPERGDVVREHPVEVLLGAGAGDADEGPWA